jgi:CubicO group peptidase (beta-lactamase class C family)
MLFLCAVVSWSAAALPQSSAPASQPAAPARIDELVARALAESGVPALAGAIVSAGRLEAIGAAGVRKLGAAAQVTIDDRWHLGSCTKSMTATLAARLVEKDKLRWETSVASALPGLAPKMQQKWRGVPIEWLLRNHGGAPADLGFDGLWGKLWQREGTHAEQRLQLAAAVLARPPAFEPGAHYLYSNAGFAIAGAMMETMQKTSWEELMQEEVFRPLGITTAGFGAPGSAGDALDQPWGHAPGTAAAQPIEPGPGGDNPPAIGPAGTVHMSIADWGRYVAAHASGEQYGGDFLSAPAFRKLHTPHEKSDYAMGWVVMQRPWAGGRVLMHNGSNTMWLSIAWVAPERDFAVLVCCNQGGEAAGKAVDKLAGLLIQDHLARAAAK